MANGIDQDVAGKFSTLAQKCTVAVQQEQKAQQGQQEKQDEPVQAVWPSGLTIPELVS